MKPALLEQKARSYGFRALLMISGATACVLLVFVVLLIHNSRLLFINLSILYYGSIFFICAAIILILGASITIARELSCIRQAQVIDAIKNS